METPGAKWIRTIREAMGLKKEQFAKKLGVHYSTVVRWELGTTRPNKTQNEALTELHVKHILNIHKKDMKATAKPRKLPAEKDKKVIGTCCKGSKVVRQPTSVRRGYIIQLPNPNNFIGGSRPAMFVDEVSADSIAQKLGLFGYKIVRAQVRTYEDLEILG